MKRRGFLGAVAAVLSFGALPAAARAFRAPDPPAKPRGPGESDWTVFLPGFPDQAILQLGGSKTTPRPGLDPDSIVEAPKDTSVFAAGDAVYWNTTANPEDGNNAGNGAATNSASGNYLWGLALANAAANAATVTVKQTAARRTNTIANSLRASVPRPPSPVPRSELHLRRQQPEASRW